ncbi:MAG: tetratricopeptide repeat protein [Bacteroidia bacterium]|nr:tetratricopeptide repeat protein [Bacteroidia bacterium]
MAHTTFSTLIAPVTVEPRHLLAKASSAMKWSFFESALHLSNSYLLFAPGHIEAQLIRAYSLLHLGEEQEARELFTKLMYRYPGSVSCLLGLADYYRVGMDYDLAEGLFFQALEMASDENTKCDIIIRLSELYVLKGELELALKTIGEALEMMPFEGMAHYQEGLVLLKMGNFEHAKRSFDISIQLNKEHAESYRLRARCWMMMNKVEYGLHDIKKAQQFELERYRILEALA